MADLFTRLAEHSLGMAPPVRPVVALLFAPTSPGKAVSGLTPTEGPGIAVFEEYLVSSPSTRAEEAVPSAERFNPGRSSPGRPPQAEPENPASEASSWSNRYQTPLVNFQPLLPRERRQGENAPAQLAPESREGHEESEASASVHIRKGESISMRAADGEAASAHLSSAGQSEHRGQEPRSPDEARHIKAQMPPMPARDASPGKLFQPGEQAASTVYVRIGRIEVKAVHPSTQTPPRPQPPRPTPALSLDEYLKQQKGGRR